MNPLDFIKQKLDQGLSTVENWGSDAGNDISNAVGHLFGTGSPNNSAPAQQNQQSNIPSPSQSSIPQGMPQQLLVQNSNQNQNPGQNPNQPQQFNQPPKPQTGLPQSVNPQQGTPIAKMPTPTQPMSVTPIQTPQVAPVKIAKANNGAQPETIQQHIRDAQNYAQNTAWNAVKSAPGFVMNTLVKPVANTVSGDIIYPSASLIAAAKGDKVTENYLNNEAWNAQQGSLPSALVKTTGQLLNAARYVPGAVGNEAINAVHPTSSSAQNISAQQGLRALNQSTVGLGLTGPEDIIAHNVPGARELASQAGFDPNQSIAAAAAKTGAGLLQDAEPLWGFEHGNPLGVMSALNTASKGVDLINAVRSGALSPNDPAIASSLLEGVNGGAPDITEEGVNRVFQQNPMLPENLGNNSVPSTIPAPPDTTSPLALEQMAGGRAASTAGQATNPIAEQLLPRGTETPTTPKTGESPQQLLSTDEHAANSSPNNSTSVPKVNTLRSLEESQNLSEGAQGVTSPYDLRKGYGVNPEDITQRDIQEAHLTSSTPEYIAGQRIVRARDLAADQAAQDVLRSGGTRDEAVDAYQKEHPGITRKDATYRVSKMARQSKLALHPNERVANPEEGQHDIPRAKPGEYTRATQNRNRIVATLKNMNKTAQKALGALSEKDRADFADYAEGTKDIHEADNPEAVQAAIDAGRKLTDTANAYDHSLGGQTPHIDQYFPGYVDRPKGVPSEADYLQAEQDLEEEVGPEEWNKLSAEQRADLVKERIGGMVKKANTDENFGGFRNQKREFANRAERRAAGVKDLFSDPRDVYNHYTKQAIGKLGNDAFAKAAQEADAANRMDKGGKVVDVRYGNGENDKVTLSEKGGRALRSENLNEKNTTPIAVKKALQAGTAVKKTIASVGVPHGIIIPKRAFSSWLGLKVHTAFADFAKTARDAGDITKAGTDIPHDNIEFSHRVGSPIQTDMHSRNPIQQFTFGWLLPKIHNQLISALRDYMEAKGINPDSAEAQNLGHQINDVMGYASGHSAIDNIVFAPSLLKSTASMYSKSVLPGNFIDRWGAMGSQVTNQVIGFVSKNISNQILQSQGNTKDQNKDDFWSTVTKNALTPSVNTPFINPTTHERITLGLPGEYQADIARIPIGTKVNNNGQVRPTLNSPSQMVTNAGQAARDILAPLPSAALTAASNQTYNGTQVRDPNASIPRQAVQTGVNLATSSLPIPASSLLSGAHAPGWLQNDIPKSSAAQSVPTPIRIAGQFLGLNPHSDTTTGNGPAIQQFYDAQKTGASYIANQSNNPQTENANMTLYNHYFARSRNDQGQTIQLTPAQDMGTAKDLYANPTVLKAVQTAQQKAGNAEPYWNLPSSGNGGKYIGLDGQVHTESQLQTYMQYKSFANGSADRTQLEQLNPWIKQIAQQDSAWYQQNTGNFTAVHSSDPLPGGLTWNDLQSPNIDPSTQSMMDEATNLSSINPTDRTAAQEQRYQQIEGDPNVRAAYQAIDNYTNAMRVAQGYSPLNFSPDEPPAVTAGFAEYDQLSKQSGQRTAWITQHPDLWNQMTNYMAQSSQATVNRGGALAELQGESPSQGMLGAEYNLGKYDIAKSLNANGTSDYSLNPSLAYANSKSGTGGKSGGSSKRVPYVALPKKPRGHAAHVRRLRTKRIKIAHPGKQQPIRMHTNTPLRPVKIGHPGPLKIK